MFEIVADLDDLDGEFALIRAMAEVSGRPLSLTVLQKPAPRADDVQARPRASSRAAEADGVPMYGQVASRPVGLDHDASTAACNPFVASPTYQKLAGLSRATRSRRRSRDPELRARVVTEVDAARDRSPLTIFSDAFPFGTPLKYDPDPATSIQAVAAQDRSLAVRGRARRARQGRTAPAGCTSR